MNHSLENNLLSVSISTKGAELQSIKNKENGLEYMWGGDPLYWSKKSPVLFPIVGGLKDNSYTHNNQTFSLGRHGFAREMEFDTLRVEENSIELGIVDSLDTFSKYPFLFAFTITYTLNGTYLSVTYRVQNKGEVPMHFSVGAHPAFKVPLVEGTSFNDYLLEFSKTENAPRYPLTKEGLVMENPDPLLVDSVILPLKKSLFYQDAIVLKNLTSNSVSLLSPKTLHGLRMDFEGFPYFGIWSAKDGDFVCLEPWCGIADGIHASGRLVEKEGINELQPQEVFERTWRAEFF